MCRVRQPSTCVTRPQHAPVRVRAVDILDCTHATVISNWTGMASTVTVRKLVGICSEKVERSRFFITLGFFWLFC